jgi:3-phosphoshikimate 1-carboxyvinyltransferase
VKGADFPEGIEPCAPPSSLVLRHPSSSQEVSALLVALAAWPDEIELVVVGPIPSRPYVDLTLHVLRGVFGAQVREVRSADAVCFRIDGPLRAPHEPLAIEADASLAAVALAAGCLSGGEVLALGLAPGSAQGDVRILEHLRAFGCDARATERGFLARGRPSRAASLDLSGEPDLAPVLAIVAADAAARMGEACELAGLGTLQGKESSRLEVLANGLGRAGWRVEASSDCLRLEPGRRAADPGITLSAENDHRMAFAFALLSLIAPEVAVTGGQAVGKSWPSFWAEMARLQLRGEG